jgi:hypothetical protein
MNTVNLSQERFLEKFSGGGGFPFPENRVDFGDTHIGFLTKGNPEFGVSGSLFFLTLFYTFYGSRICKYTES